MDYQALAAHFDNPAVVGILCTGSFARGQAAPYSDIDLHLYVSTQPENTYRLVQWNDSLVSLSFDTIADERAKLGRPMQAIWAVPGLRQARILLDKDGSLEKLKQDAMDFNWAHLQSAADDYALSEQDGFAEEARKILNGLLREHESTVLYAATGLSLGLARAVAVQRGLLIDTENNLFDLIQDSVGRNNPWTFAFRLALGADISPAALRPYICRGKAALALYRETAYIFKTRVPRNLGEVTETTLSLIEAAII